MASPTFILLLLFEVDLKSKYTVGLYLVLVFVLLPLNVLDGGKNPLLFSVTSFQFCLVIIPDPDLRTALCESCGEFVKLTRAISWALPTDLEVSTCFRLAELFLSNLKNERIPIFEVLDSNLGFL